MARELRTRGATVIVTDLDPSDARFERLRQVDPTVLMIGESHVHGAGHSLLRRMRQDTRLRWASQLVVRWEEVWSDRTGELGIQRFESTLAGLAEPEEALRARADVKAPFDTRLETMGPARCLRALSACGHALRVSVQNPRAEVTVDLSDGLIVGAAGRAIGDNPKELEGANALAALLLLGSGRVHVEAVNQPATANVMAPVDVALNMADAEPPPIAPSIPVAGALSIHPPFQGAPLAELLRDASPLVPVPTIRIQPPAGPAPRVALLPAPEATPAQGTLVSAHASPVDAASLSELQPSSFRNAERLPASSGAADACRRRRKRGSPRARRLQSERPRMPGSACSRVRAPGTRRKTPSFTPSASRSPRRRCCSRSASSRASDWSSSTREHGRSAAIQRPEDAEPVAMPTPSPAPVAVAKPAPSDAPAPPPVVAPLPREPDGSGRTVEDCKTLLAASPPHDGYYPGASQEQSRLGRAAIVRGDLKEARRAYCRAVHWNPRNLDVVLQLAQALLLERDGAKALEYAEIAAAIDPNPTRVQEVLGDAYARVGAYADARRAWFAAAALDPTSDEATRTSPVTRGAPGRPSAPPAKSRDRGEVLPSRGDSRAGEHVVDGRPLVRSHPARGRGRRCLLGPPFEF